jgi:hypothetical protein
MEQRDFAQVMERHGTSGSRTIFDPEHISRLEEAWAPMLAGIKSGYHRRVCAMAFQAQLEELQRAKSMRGGNLTEEVTTANTGSYTKYIFPILRKLFPNLIAHNLVTVQPMNAPVGAVFYWDYKYGTTKGSVVAGTTAPGTDPYYSSEYINGEGLGTGDAAKWGGAGAAANWQLSFYPIRPLNTTYNYSVVIREETVAGAIIQTATDNGSGTFVGDVQAGSVINYATGAVTGFKFTAAPGAGRLVKAYYSYNMEMNSLVPEYNFDIAMEAVAAKPRKMKFKWSPESMEDLSAYHGMSGESELVSGVASQMLYEIDREVIQDVSSFAAQGTTATFDMTVPAEMVNTLDALRRIFLPMNDITAAIHRKTMRGPANWIVTSPQMVGLLESFATHQDYRGIFTRDSSPTGDIDYQVVDPAWGGISSNMGVTKIGVLNKKWMVYQDPSYAYNRMLFGLKGGSFLDAGYAWCPYVTIQMTQSFEDPNDFSIKKGVRSRYATKRLRPEWYGLMSVTGWTQV